MISIRCVKEYCIRYTEIENYDVAVNSPIKYVCHHRREVQNGVQKNVNTVEVLYEL